ncbi:hypothetical protein [Amycolatopsis arida]|uniref:hypothetical protein n=1 Tax=Amycolatopsis arida TaxID=587909 RepID=UPI000AFE37C0|nr:hypothetical protein [Amycolatopsis arida]
MRDDDPAWAWWINDQELAWHEATVQADSADRISAADTVQASVAGTPATAGQLRYLLSSAGYGPNPGRVPPTRRG